MVLGVAVMVMGLQEATRYLPEVAGHPSFAPAFRLIITGIILVLFIRFRPQGLLPERRMRDKDPSGTGVAPDGGGQVGALLLSPFIKQGVSQEPYNHFSLLRTIEDLFGLTHLGYAGLSKISSFEPSIFSAHPSG